MSNTEHEQASSPSGFLVSWIGKAALAGLMLGVVVGVIALLQP